MTDALRLTEQVWPLMRAVIRLDEYWLLEEEGEGATDGEIVFGEVDPKEFKKKRKSKSKLVAHKRPLMNDIIRASVAPPVDKPTEDELISLAEQARQAAGEASKLAGEPVIFCCSRLWPKSKHKRCYNRTEPRYVEINRILNGEKYNAKVAEASS